MTSLGCSSLASNTINNAFCHPQHAAYDDENCAGVSQSGFVPPEAREYRARLHACGDARCDDRDVYCWSRLRRNSGCDDDQYRARQLIHGVWWQHIIQRDTRSATAPESARGCKLDRLSKQKPRIGAGRGSLHRLVRPWTIPQSLSNPPMISQTCRQSSCPCSQKGKTPWP